MYVGTSLWDPMCTGFTFQNAWTQHRLNTVDTHAISNSLSLSYPCYIGVPTRVHDKRIYNTKPDCKCTVYIVHGGRDA